MDRNFKIPILFVIDFLFRDERQCAKESLVQQAPREDTSCSDTECSECDSNAMFVHALKIPRLQLERP